MPADPRRAALEALFVIREEDGGRMAALTLPSIPSGGWAEREDGGERQNPYGAKARVLALRDAVITEALRLIDASTPESGAVLAGIVRAEEHERAALVRERDEALAKLKTIAADHRHAEEGWSKATQELWDARAEVATLKAELAARSPEGRRAAQLGLFATPSADPAGEAQRASASGTPVGALVGAAADAPAPPEALAPLPDAYKPKPRACGTCGQFGHNARTCGKGAGRG